MTDKVQKIREEVVRLHNLLPIKDGDNIFVNHADRICTTLEMYIDTMQGEQVDYGKLKTSLDNALSKETKESWDKFLQEEPVNEDLEEAAITAADEDMRGRQIMEESNENRQLYSRTFRRGFKAGANWQKQRMMKEAVDSEACYTMGVPSIIISLPDGIKVRDKVKVIIIKEG